MKVIKFIEYLKEDLELPGYDAGVDLTKSIKEIFHNTLSTPKGFYYIEGKENAIKDIQSLASENGLKVPDERTIKIILHQTLKAEKEFYYITGQDEAAAQLIAVMEGE